MGKNQFILLKCIDPTKNHLKKILRAYSINYYNNMSI